MASLIARFMVSILPGIGVSQIANWLGLGEEEQTNINASPMNPLITMGLIAIIISLVLKWKK